MNSKITGYTVLGFIDKQESDLELGMWMGAVLTLSYFHLDGTSVEQIKLVEPAVRKIRLGYLRFIIILKHYVNRSC